MKKKFHETMEDYIFENFSPGVPRSEAKRRYKEKFERQLYDQFFDDPLIDVKSIIESKKDYQLMSTLYSSDHANSYGYMMYTFIRDDGKVFEIDGKLAEALYNTDISFYPEEIHFPFKTLVLYIKDSTIPHYGFNDNKLFKYKVQYIMLTNHSDGDRKFLTYVLGFLDDGADEDDFFGWNNTTLFNASAMYGAPLKKTDLLHWYPAKKIPESAKEKLSESSEGIINFLFNFALYVSEKSDDVIELKPNLIDVSKRKSQSKIQQANRTNYRESSYSINYVGQKYYGVYRKSFDLIEKARTPIAHRSLVRGHWRLQWYGKRTISAPGAFQKRIWIEPFYKGFEIDDGKNNICC